MAKARALLGVARDFGAALGSPERNIEEFLAKTRTVVTATCVGIGQARMRIDASPFDWVIVDEAARCTPGELAVPLQVGRRVLLVGDHLQLEPMIDADVLEELRADMPEADPRELKRSDFERARSSGYGEANGKTLTEQYRMAPAICNLVSETFYVPNRIRLATSADRKADPAFAGGMQFPLEYQVTWVDTSGQPGAQEQAPGWALNSKVNEAEVEAILGLLQRLSEDAPVSAALAASKEETPIGVICMYKAQKVRVEQEFGKRPWAAAFKRLVRIETVDSYQGKENTVVIVSLVRSNRQGDAGHVSSPNRCNVALSRAKERLFIVGAMEMWRRVPLGQPMRKVADWCWAARSGSASLDAKRL